MTAAPAKSDFMDEFKRAEVTRAVKLEQEEVATKVILDKLRDNPNSHLHEVSTEVQMLNRKIDPILKRVEAAQMNIKNSMGAGSLSSQPGAVGMLSKMSGRLIAFYADDLAEAMLEDFLSETAKDLQSIEAKERRNYGVKETERIAEAI